MLENDRDIKIIAKDRASNMSKLAQVGIVDLREQLLRSNSGGFIVQSVSPQLMAVKSVNALVSKLREAGDMSRLLQPGTLTRLVEVLHRGVSDEMTNRILCILESYTVSTACVTVQWQQATLEKLVAALAKLLSPTLDTVLHRHILILRLCLNLVNHSETNATLFAEVLFINKLSSLILSGFEIINDSNHTIKDAGHFDALVLSLGTIMTLAEMSDAPRRAIAFTQGDSLNRLVQIFVDHRLLSAEAESLEQSHANVAYGYLAVMLANMCRNRDIRPVVSNALPGKGVDMLLGAVDEFIQYHKTADEKDEGNDVWVAFTNRLQSAADAVGRC